MTKESIAIVGGGIGGIACALELSKTASFSITVFEKEKHLGGLSSYYQWNDIIFDRFYHVILPTDNHLINFVTELGLESELFWRPVKSGFYKYGKIASMSSILDFIRFPFLSPWQKIRLGLGILYATNIKVPDKLDKIYAKQWLSKIFGERIYQNIWEPLLQSKLGNATEIVSAAFIWATISRLYGTRSSKEKRERMGHVIGGYNKILKCAQRRLEESKVKLITNTRVQEIDLSEEDHIILKATSGSMRFDRLVLTVSCPEVLRILAGKLNNQYWQKIQTIKYCNIICVLLVLKKKLSPYYVINLLDRSIPFTGIIESTNIISPSTLDNNHLVYLPKYTTDEDPINTKSDEEIKTLFIKRLRDVYPKMNDEDILFAEVFRESYVQPIQERNFSEKIVSFRTPQKKVFLVNSSMIQDSTLNNNAIIKLARDAVKIINNDNNKM